MEDLDWQAFGLAQGSDDSAFQQSPSPSPCGPDCWLRKGLPDVEISSEVAESDVPEGYNRSNVEKLLYSPLTSWQTRLVELEPGSIEEPLKCQLCKAEIIYFEGLGIQEKSGVVHFEAISYSWGRPELTYALTCNDMMLTVPPTLAAALRSLRYPQKSRYLWVDAICINQADKDEKAAQIGIMYTIFHKASRVVAWLGEEISAISTAFRLLHPGGQGRRQQHDEECTLQAARADAALQELLQRPWFRRTWVRLEVFAARKIMLRCGTHETDFHDLVNLGPRWISRTFRLTSSRPSLLDTTRASVSVEEPQSEKTEILIHTLNQGASLGLVTSDVLLVTLEHGKLFQTSEPRDFVYAILGLIANLDKGKDISRRLRSEDMEYDRLRNMMDAIAKFPIKSSKSVSDSEVFQDVMKFAINEDRDLQVLWRYEIQPDRASDIPSWAIDWRQHWEKSLANGRETLAYERYLAARDDLRIKPAKITRWTQPGVPPLQDLHHSGFLRLKGSRLGTVTRVENVSLEWLESGGHWLSRDLVGQGHTSSKLLDLLSYHVVASAMHEPLVQTALKKGVSFGDAADELQYISATEGLIQQNSQPFASVGDVVVFLWGSKHPFLIKHIENDRFNYLGVFNTGSISKYLRIWESLPPEEFHLE